MNLHRFRQVANYGWLHAGQIGQEAFRGGKRLSLFFDILGCYRKYKMWSNQYLKERFWELDKVERDNIGNKYRDENLKKEAWVKDFYDNRKFLAKWSKYEIEASASKREKRNAEYARRYAMGKDCHVEYGVEFSRQHHLPGTISIGNRCLFAKNVFLDYSGELIIHDDVALANGVIIETHTHLLEKKGAPPAPSRLEIEKGVQILSHAYIADTCHSIGRYARIGAGTYVRSNVLPYSIMIGNPAKIVGFMYSPEEVAEFEKTNFPESERTDLEKYKQDYKKYYIDRRKEIKSILQK